MRYPEYQELQGLKKADSQSCRALAKAAQQDH